MEQTEEWLANASEALGINDPIAVKDLLATTRDVAHGVTRPAAPLTTYLIGVAVARGTTVDDATSAIGRCLSEWEAAHPSAES